MNWLEYYGVRAVDKGGVAALNRSDEPPCFYQTTGVGTLRVGDCWYRFCRIAPAETGKCLPESKTSTPLVAGAVA